METETWKDVPGYEGYYQASSFGRIRSLDRDTTFFNPAYGKRVTTHFRGRVLRSVPDSHGKYLHLALCVPGDKVVTVRVHRLVTLAFHGRPTSERCQAAHKDGNSFNNFACNLYWASRLENARDKLNHGTYLRGARHPKIKLSVGQKERIRTSELPAKALAEELGVTAQYIRQLRRDYASL